MLAYRRTELARAGILYPDLTPASAAHEPHLNHLPFGQALDGRRPRRELDELLQKLSGELARTDAEIVLLSYEGFSQQRHAARIASLLSSFFGRHGFAMEVVVVVRPQSEYLNSMYSLRLQLMRERTAFRDFAPRFQHSGRLAYGALLQPWGSACGARVRAMPLLDRRSTAPLVERFGAQLGVWDRIAPLLDPSDHVRVENRSLGPVAAEVSRRLRWMRVHARIRVRPREMVRHVQEDARRRGLDATAFRGVGPDLRARLESRYKDANERFAGAAWKRPWAAVVASEPVEPVNEIAAGPVDQETDHLVTSLLQDACRRFGVIPVRPLLAAPTDLLADGMEGLQRTLRVPSWRVR